MVCRLGHAEKCISIVSPVKFGVVTTTKSTYSVKKGKTVKLGAKVTPSGAKITYTSSNKKIATVTSKGVVKGIKKGTAKITIKADGVKKVVKVKVK